MDTLLAPPLPGQGDSWPLLSLAAMSRIQTVGHMTAHIFQLNITPSDTNQSFPLQACRTRVGPPPWSFFQPYNSCLELCDKLIQFIFFWNVIGETWLHP